MKRVETDSVESEGEQRLAIRARRDLLEETSTKSNNVVKQRDGGSSSHRGILPNDEIIEVADVPAIDSIESSPETAWRLSSAAADVLVCTKCTFRNKAKLLFEGNLTPPVCEVCAHPLGQERQQQRQSSSSRSDPPQALAETAALSDVDRDVDKRSSTSWRLDSTIAIPKPSPIGHEQTGLKCPVCTVWIPDGIDKKRCPVCDAVLRQSAVKSSSSEARHLLQRECVACTLVNSAGALVCSACETPLCDGGNSSVDEMLLGPVTGDETGIGDFSSEGTDRRRITSDGIAITSELKTQTTEEGGDTKAFTVGLVPHLHERLVAQYKAASKHQQQRQHGKKHAARRTTSGLSPPRPPPTGGRGALDWFLPAREISEWERGRDSSAGGNAGRGAEIAAVSRAEWKLCNPTAAHCSQRGAPGSGYSCGYRNIQMVCSALMEIPEYQRREVLFDGSGCIPGILLLQCWLERAWADGYDPEGCEQLGGLGALVGSEKWIGATECATLLRSFGVKAEVIDFETEASVRMRSGKNSATNTSASQSAQQNKNETPNTDRKPGSSGGPTKSRRDGDQKQKSILSFWNAGPERQSLGSASNGCSKRISREIDESPVQNLKGSTSIRGQPLPRPNQHSSVGRLCVSESDENATPSTVENDTSARGESSRQAANSQPRLNDGRLGAASPQRNGRRAKSSRSLTGGRGNGHLGASEGDLGARVAAGQGGQRHGEGWRRGSGRGRGRGKGRGRGSGGNSNNIVGNRCGQAVAEWAWEYFCTPWTLEQEPSLEGKREMSCGNVSRQNRAGEFPENLKADENCSKPNAEEIVSAKRQAGYSNEDCADLTAESRGGDSSDDPGDGDSASGEVNRDRAVLSSERTRQKRLPPPLYLQHDGHSRTVVGVLWPGGRGSLARDGGGGDSTASSEVGGGKQPGTLLVFDPSHSGREVRDALANEDNLGWCRLLKRGAQSLQRQQFQMVAVRPGLVEPDQADAWKKIVSTKIQVA